MDKELDGFKEVSTSSTTKTYLPFMPLSSYTKKINHWVAMISGALLSIFQSLTFDLSPKSSKSALYVDVGNSYDNF